MNYSVGMLCKHFKGTSLLEKNIYRIEELGVKGSDINDEEVAYYGKKDLKTTNNLVVYSNIFQEGKKFCREYEDLAEELSSDEQIIYGQKHRVEPLNEEEIAYISESRFIKEKEEYVRTKFPK